MEEKQLTADSPESFIIFINCYDGKIFSVLVSLDDTVRDLKSKLNAQDSILTPESGRLIYNGTEMEDDQTLRHYQITPNCSVHHTLTLPFGGRRVVQLGPSGLKARYCPSFPWKHLTERLESAWQRLSRQKSELLTKRLSEAGEEGTDASAGSHLGDTYYLLNHLLALQRRCRLCRTEILPQLVPKIFHDTLKNRTEYQAQLPAAGIFQCCITGLSFKVKSAVTVTYRYASWTRHLSKAEQDLWVPAGPLFHIEVQPEVVQAVYLPHFICLAEAVDTSLCSIAHFKSGIITLEKPTRLVPFSAVLENPSFSLLGVLWRRLRSTLHSFPAHSLVLIFLQLSAANTTLHLYLIPDDNSVKRAVEGQESNWNSKLIPKPSPFRPLFYGCDYWVTSNNSVVITPEPRLPLCYKSPKEHQPFLEIYIKDMAEELELRMMDKSKDAVVWRASLRSGDIRRPACSSRSSSGAAFIRKHKTELCCRMRQIDTILLHLRDANVINSDEEEEVQAKGTSKRQSRALLDLVEQKGVKAQEQLYRILQEKDPFLVGSLEMA